MTVRPERILFTGFGPFGRVLDNPSAHVARAAAEQIGAQAQVLDVTFEKAAEIARQAVADHVVHFGVARSRAWVALERTACNVVGFDVGEVPRERVRPRPADPQLPAQARSAFPLESLRARLAEEWSGDVRISDDAGAFVCNATLLHALCADPQRFFVHVPDFSAEQARCFGAAFGRAYLDVLAQRS